MISIEDILFPKATVNKLARAILPEGGLISKDSSTALQRSSTVFVSYLLVHARQHAKQFDRKTIGPQDIINALEKAEFSSFIPSVSEELDSFQARKDAQKKKKREEKLAQALAQSQTQVTTQSDVVPDQKMKEASEETIDEQEDNGNETVEEVDSMETLDNDETQVEETRGPVSKKLKSDSREDTVSDAETESQQE